MSATKLHTHTKQQAKTLNITSHKSLSVTIQIKIYIPHINHGRILDWRILDSSDPSMTYRFSTMNTNTAHARTNY